MIGFAVIGAGNEGTSSAIDDKPDRPCGRPPLAKPEDASAVETRFTSPAAMVEKAAESRTEVSATEANRAEQTVRFPDGTAVPFAKVPLATGAPPRSVKCPGGEAPGVLTATD